MKLYLLERPDGMLAVWEEYIAFVVAAENEEDARTMRDKSPSCKNEEWIPADKVVVTLLAEDTPVKRGVVLDSYYLG